MDLTPVALLLNCGFARVAVYELSTVKRGKCRCSVNDDITSKFKKLFESCSSFTMPDEYLVINKNHSLFHRHCNYLLDCFSRKWSTGLRSQYLEKFSTQNWKDIPSEQKSSHSLKNCSACAKKYLEL